MMPSSPNTRQLSSNGATSITLSSIIALPTFAASGIAKRAFVATHGYGLAQYDMSEGFSQEFLSAHMEMKVERNEHLLLILRQ